MEAAIARTQHKSSDIVPPNDEIMPNNNPFKVSALAASIPLDIPEEVSAKLNDPSFDPFKNIEL